MKRKVLLFGGAFLLVIPLLVVADGVDEPVSNNTGIEQNEDKSVVTENINQSLNQNDAPNDDAVRQKQPQATFDRPCMADNRARGGFGDFSQQQTIHVDMLAYAKKYTPNKVAEWERVLEERATLREQWFANRPSMNNNVRCGQGNGFGRHMNRANNNQNTDAEYFNDQPFFCQDVYAAVEQGNEAEIKRQLDMMLDHLKDRNTYFKDLLK